MGPTVDLEPSYCDRSLIEWNSGGRSRKAKNYINIIEELSPGIMNLGAECMITQLLRGIQSCATCG